MPFGGSRSSGGRFSAFKQSALEELESAPLCIAYSPYADKEAVIVLSDGSLVLFDGRGIEAQEVSLSDATDVPLCACYYQWKSGSGNLLIVLGLADGSLLFTDLENTGVVEGHSAPCASVAPVTIDRKEYVCSVGHDGTVAFWKFSGTELEVVDTSNVETPVHFMSPVRVKSKNTPAVAIAGADGAAAFVSVPDGEVAAIDTGCEGQLTCVCGFEWNGCISAAFGSANGEIVVAVMTEDGETLLLQTLFDNRSSARSQPPLTGIYVMAEPRDSNAMVVALTQRTIRVFSVGVDDGALVEGSTQIVQLKEGRTTHHPGLFAGQYTRRDKIFGLLHAASKDIIPAVMSAAVDGGEYDPSRTQHYLYTVQLTVKSSK